MTAPVPIEYREFYDVPRLFIAEHDGVTYLFDGSFDGEIDEYPDEYAVGTLPPMDPIERAGSWEHLSGRIVQPLGTVSVTDVLFDSTRRKTVDASIFQGLSERLMRSAVIATT